MNLQLLKQWFRELEPVGADPEGGVTRLAYTAEEDAMFEKVAGFASALGFSVTEDCIGNMFISFPDGTDRPCHMVGSHLDSVPRGGRYDGVVGVLAGLLVMEKILRLGLSIPVKTAAFRAEESSLYGLATAGSGTAAGSIDAVRLRNAKSLSGDSLYDTMTRKGYAPGSCRLEPVIDFTELHIEQGRVLWEAKEPLGVVTAIAAPTRLKVTIHGRQDHSGATPMDLRKDGLCAAAEIILGTEQAGNAEAAHATVATVGVAHVRPNALNVVPGLVELRIDIRGILKESISRTVGAVRNTIRETELQRGILCEAETLSSMDPVTLAPSVIDSLAGAAEKTGVPFRRMASGAGHDAMKVAAVAPAGMLFIPCREGISHNPGEEASLEDVALGAEILLEALKIRRHMGV
jgi:N-carbamoyl-L-amino-acid hydrolase